MTAADNFNDLLVIYEEEAEDWAAYIRSIFQNDLPEGVLLYNLEASSMEHLPMLACYQCKVLILSQGLLDLLDDIKVTFLVDLLHPPDNVVILLCGVEHSDALYELAPIQRACHELLADQDPEDYLSVICSVINQGTASADSCNAHEDFVTPDDSEEIEEPSWDIPVNSPATEMKRISVLVLPKRISCENPEEIFIVLKEETVYGEAIEIEFTTHGQLIRVQPDVWNEKVLCIKAPEFPAGTVNVNVYYEGVIRATAEIEYYTAMGEIETLLRKAADPVNFICRAFNVDSPEKLDDILTNSLRGKMPGGEVSNFFEDAVVQNQDICQSGEYPTLLHFATKFGFKNLTSLLTQCPGAVRASRMINGVGDDPASLAKKHGHEDLRQLLQKVSISTWENEYLKEAEEETEDEHIYVAMHSASDPHTTMASYEQWQEDLVGQGKEDEPDDEEGEEDEAKVEAEDGAEDEAEDEAEANSEKYRDNFDYADNLYDEIEDKEGTMKRSNPFRHDKQPLHAPLPATGPLMQENVYVFSQEQSWKWKQDTDQLWMDQEAYRDEEDDDGEEEDPYSLASNSDLYDHILSTCQEKRKGRKSFIINRPPAPAPRPPSSVLPTNESSAPFIAQVFQQKTTTKLPADDKDVYSLRQPVRPLSETYVTMEKRGSLPSGQEELILLQEKVKQGLMTMDEALEKFKQWQNEQSGSDQAQKEKLRQLRGCLIGSRPEEDYLYDKITIVHQPKAAAEKTPRATPAIDSVYVKLNKPRVPPRVPRERDQGHLRTYPKIK